MGSVPRRPPPRPRNRPLRHTHCGRVDAPVQSVSHWHGCPAVRYAPPTAPTLHLLQAQFLLDAVDGVANGHRPDSPRLRYLGVGQAMGELDEYLPLTVRQSSRRRRISRASVAAYRGERPSHDFRGQPKIAHRRAPQGREQLLHVGLLQDITRSASGHRLHHGVLRRRGRQHHHANIGGGLHDLPARLHAILPGHDHVHQHQVRRNFGRHPDGLFTVRGLTHHLELAGQLQHLLQPDPHDLMVVDDHHPYALVR